MDYWLTGLEKFVASERQRPRDLMSCLEGQERERLERELSRLRGLDYGALVIECDLADLAAGNYRSKMRPRAVVQSLLAFSVRYRLPIFFCPGREYAARVVESLLTKYLAELQKRMKAVAA